MTRIKAALLLSLAMALVAAACGSSGSGDEAADGEASLPAVLEQSADVAAAGDAGAPGDRTDGTGLDVIADDGPASPSSLLQVTADGGSTVPSSTATSSTETSPGQTSTSASDGSSTTGPTSSTAPATTATSTTGSRPATTARPTTTASTTASTATTSAPTTSTTSRPSGNGYFATLPPGSSLPTGQWCAGQVKPRPEVRAGNATYNQTRGTASNGRFPRVDGNFVGTTDEIIQWAACKWGIDEDWARAQSAKESWWDMTTGGDRTSDQSACYPAVRTSSGACPESLGLLQVRFLYHGEAFQDGNAMRSTAYNADYTYAVWRACYEGELTWLNTVERGAEYRAGDLEGCLGVWFSGRWYVPDGVAYTNEVRNWRATRIWEQPNFLNYG